LQPEDGAARRGRELPRPLPRPIVPPLDRPADRARTLCMNQLTGQGCRIGAPRGQIRQTGCPKRAAGEEYTEPVEDVRLALRVAPFQDVQPARRSIAEAAIIAKITQNQATNLHPPSVPFPVENSAPKSS